MAKVRIGFSTAFELENELVGIGTDNPTNTLQALGNIHSSNAKAVGVSTLTTFDGFVDTKAGISGLEGSEQGSISGEIIIEGSATVSTGSTFRSGPENLTATDSFTLPGISDDKPSVGTTRFNEDLRSLEFYTGSEWRAVNSYVDMGNRGRGLIMGGDASSKLSSIGFVEISTQGNEQNFGDLTQSVGIANGDNISSSIRGLRCGGFTPSLTDTIDYTTIASQGNAIDFGNQTAASEGGGGCSSSTRGVIVLGRGPGGHVNTIDYVQIPTIGNAVDFGDLVLGTGYNGPNAVSNGIRGVFCGGITPSYAGGTAEIQSLTIASKGNTTTFGNLTGERRNIMPCSNSTRGVLMGGRNNTGGAGTASTIDYITIASGGNAVDFGKLNTNRFRGAGTSNQTRGICASGDTASPGANSKVIEMVTIATTGSAEDFGDVLTASDGPIGLSDSHGGLGGF